MKGIYSPNSSESFAMFDREGRLLKMCQGYLQPTLDSSFEMFCGSLPRQGMTLSGTLFHVPKWAVSTCENDFGLLQAKASDNNHRKPGRFKVTQNGTYRYLDESGNQSFMRLSQVAQLLPTPTASNALNGNGYQRDRNGNVYPTLSGAVGAASLPTPTKRDGNTKTKDAPNRQGSPSLTNALLATPTRIDANNNYRQPTKGGRNLSYETGCDKKRKLNPNFVVAMMGFPPGWLDLT